MHERHHKPWWTVDGRGQAHSLRSTVEKVEQLSRGRRADDILHMRLYGNRDVAGLGQEVRYRESDRQRLRYNLCQAIVDALIAHIAQLRPRPRFLTDRGKWSERKKAEAMEQAVDGEFYRNDMDELGPDVALDAFTTGTGFAKVLRTGIGYPTIERPLSLEVMVDPRAGMRGKPRELYQVQPIERQTLLELFPDSKTEILRADVVRDSQFPLLFRDTTIEQVDVYEAWHLPSSPDANDGRHVIAMGDHVLLDEAWTRMNFPFAVYRWQKRQMGFWGRGAIEEVKPQQVEINQTLEKIQYILHNVSTVRHWVQAGGKIELSAKKMTNTPGEILKYYGPNPPITDVVNAVPRELFEHVSNLRADAFAQVGLSEFAASSERPAGVNSGEAIRAYQDVGSKRFVLKGRQYEAFHMDVAKLVIQEKNEIANDDNEPEVAVKAKVRKGRGATVRTIEWGKVALDEENYILEVLPQSALPGTPVGRIATIEGWIASGLITPQEGKELLDFPDIQEQETMEQATRDNILSAIEVMIDDGKYVVPEPMMDLELAMQLVSVAYNRHRWEGAPEAHLELLTRFNDDVVAMQEDAAAAAAQQAAIAQPQQPPQVGAALPQGALQPPALVA